ncbi:MAG: discoidin domain-containing protein, partial [Tannerellaceae bacterium]|nr:discoidin domain-containing protein [Tannerellaceae bacterium]
MKANQLLSFIIGVAGMSALLPGCLSGESSRSGYYTRGVGAYPGDPAEDFAPELIVDNGYRNIAGMRSAYHSSSYDYNLTAQLTTDGIIASSLPATINVSTQNGDLLKNEREWLFDGKSDSKYRMEGGDVFLRLALNNIDLHVDRIALRGSVTYDAAKPLGYEITAYGSDDGESWTVIGEDKGAGRIGTPPPVFRGFGGFMRPPVDPDAPKPSFTFNFPAPEPSTNIDQVFELDGAVNYSFYKISISMPSAKEWSFGDWDFYNGDELLAVTPSGYFSSAWESAGTGEEWVYVDFGAPASFDKVNLHWINKALTGAIQVSGDAKTWSNIATLPGGDDRTDVIELTKKARGQYLRVLMTEAENNLPYVLSELEVWGEGGLSPRAHKQPEPGGDRLALSGGGWKLSRASEVGAGGEDISLPGFNHDGWIIATVPGTVLTSYLRIGALPDPNYADNQLQVSESFFNSDFWYRDEFDLPASFDGGRVFLNFDGINWKANVFVNGQKAGRVEGAFMRGKFDVTGLVAKGKNAIAVEIIKNAHPGAIKEQTALSTDQNGGILGADNPTFHASVGWDWIPTIRGRNIGIWNDVFLTHSGAVTIEDPFIRAELPLPDTTSAALFVEVTLKNHTDSPVTGTLKGAYGDITFEQEVTLGASETRLISLTPLTTPALNIKDPILWWPKGYGEPYLYDASLSFETGSGLSDHTAFKSGIRQMTFNEDNNTLTMFVNGRRFIGFGGNWGFGESNLNYRGREYDIAVAYHADMNFTMIRNWVGQIGDEEFYEACDRHGVMVWQDF